MKRKILSAIAILTLGSLTMETQAATTVLLEDFEGYSIGSSLSNLGWTGEATNSIAVVTNGVSSQVCDFSGYAMSGQNNIGVYLSGIAVSNNISPFLSDYTLNFDLAKLSGTNSWETQVEINFPGGALARYDVADPEVGSGPHHFSVNLTDFVYSEGSLFMEGLTNVNMQIKYRGPGPDTGSQLIEYQVDNLSLTMDVTPFYLETRSPTVASLGLDPTISGSVIDLGAEVGIMTIFLDDEFANIDTFDGGSSTNTITYDALGLSVGAHNVKIESEDVTGEINRTFKWDFYAYTNGPTIPVGFDGFESYPTGRWNVVFAPDANPGAVLNGGSAESSIVDFGDTNQMLRLNINLNGSWQAGMAFNLDLNGLNTSKDMDDYALQFNMNIGSNSTENLGNFYLHIYDEANPQVGSSFNLATNLSGGAVSIPLGAPNGLAQGAAHLMDGSASTWRVLFLVGGSGTSGDQPIEIDIDNMVVQYTEPRFLNPAVSPMGVAAQEPTVSATVYDGTEEVDSMALYIDGVVVTNDFYAGGSTTNTISYDWIGAPSGSHIGMVVAESTTYAQTNSWTFYVPVPPPQPSNNPLELYNINFEGSSNGNVKYLCPVPDGLVAGAPSVGEDLWVNIDYVNIYWAWGEPTKVIAEASGDSFLTAELWIDPDSPNLGFYLPWTWGSAQETFDNAASKSVWATALGGTPSNVDMELRSLSPTDTYDLYLYFVNPGSGNSSTSTYTITAGSAPNVQASLTSSRDSVYIEGSYTNTDNYVENENYVVITGITPTSGGIIGLNVFASTGGLSAMQLVKRGVDIVPPSINNLTLVDGEAYFEWNSTTGFSYSVFSTTNLLTGPWVEVTNGVYGDGWMLAPATSEEEFFKVQIQ